MAIFSKNKTPKPALAAPATYKSETIKSLVDCFRIGSRIRFHREYEDAIVMESIIIGYCIEGQLIFQPKQVVIKRDDAGVSISVKTKNGIETYSRLSEFFLLLPADVDLESQLDTDSRATLGKRGPFVKGNFLKLMSFQPGQDNLCCEAIVNRNMKMNSGLYAGRAVTQLELCLGTVEVFEPRCEARVNTALPVNLHVNDEREFLEAEMLDFSETAIRIGLRNSKDEWPNYGKKDRPVISFTVPITNALMTVECQCSGERGLERIFEIERIKRQGQLVAFTDLDALELKINLLSEFEDE